jgi:2'-5' RNA ligase
VTVRANEPKIAADQPPPTDSLWIGYPIPPEVAADLALPDGQSADSLHLTLAYLGKLAGLADDAPDRARAAVEALSFAAQPVPIRLNGVARFPATDSSGGKDVLYATVTSDELCYLRERLCNALYQVGLSPLTTHEYVPHVTLAYIDPDAEPVTATLPNVALSLDTLAVTAGGETEAYPLRGLFLWTSSGGRTRLFSEIRLAAEPPEWLPLLPIPGEYKHPVYGQLSLTRERLADFAAGVNAGVYLPKLPINAEHTDDTDGALGWIVEARQNADGSVDGRIEWTDRGREAIEKDRFLYVSPEWFDLWSDPLGNRHENVVIGAALCTKPFFKPPYLRPLAATDPLVPPTPAVTGTTLPEVTMSDAQNPGAGAAPQPAANPPTAEIPKALTDRLAALEAENTALKTAGEAQAATLKTATETIAAMRREERRKRFTDEVRGRSDANGNMWAGEVAANVQVLETLADSVGEESEVFTAFVAQQRATAAQIKAGGLFSELGSGQSGTGEGASAWSRIEAEARKIAADEKVTVQQATALVMERDPKLYAEYRAEQRKGA